MNPLNSIVNYPTQECCQKEAESPNLLETFKRKKAMLQERMDAVDAAIKALEDNPGINTLLELIAKAR